jgi:hypothetical protein
MVATDLQEVANAVIRRAKRQGSVRLSDIREELARSRVPEKQWKEVVSLSGPLLRYHRGRYYYEALPATPLQKEETQQKLIQQTVRQLIRHYKKDHARIERREQGRISFVQTVKIRTDDHRECSLLSRDLSETGIRLVGTASLLGHKVEVEVPGAEGMEPARFRARILWTCSVGDGLFENGGVFLEVIASQNGEDA